MLSNKNRMSNHRGLFAVIGRVRRREPLPNEISGMPLNCSHALPENIGIILPVQPKLPSKIAFVKDLKYRV
jgi:hypothetical protein